MDIQRTLLIIGLAVVSYLMILQWQEDYGKRATVEIEQNNTQSYPQVSIPSDVDNLTAIDASSLSQDIPMAQGNIIKSVV